MHPPSEITTPRAKRQQERNGDEDSWAAAGELKNIEHRSRFVGSAPIAPRVTLTRIYDLPPRITFDFFSITRNDDKSTGHFFARMARSWMWWPDRDASGLGRDALVYA